MDILRIFQQSSDKKKMQQEDQLRKINKSRIIHEQNALNSTTKSQIQPSMAESVSSSKSVLSSYDQLDKLLNNDLMSFIVNADQSLVEIKDEDIIFDEQIRKRRKQKKNRQIDVQVSQAPELESPEIQRKTAHQPTNSSENFEEEKKKIAQKRNQDQKMMLSNFKVVQIDERPVDDVRDTEIFQYSYENSVDEEYDDEDEKIKRKKLIEEKVPIPKNVVQAQDNIVFDILKKQMGDLETEKSAKQKKLLELFNIEKSKLTISIKSGQVNENDKWYFMKQQYILKEKLLKQRYLTSERIKGFFTSNDLQRKPLLKIKQNTTRKQIF